MDSITVTVTLNGNSPKATKSCVEGNTIVKLSSYATENSGFNWKDFSYKNTILILENIVIYDEYDLRCLFWFLCANFQIDMTKSYINFNMLKKLTEQLTENDFGKKWGLKLTLPSGCSLKEMEILEYAKDCFNKKGVKY